MAGVIGIAYSIAEARAPAPRMAGITLIWAAEKQILAAKKRADELERLREQRVGTT
jgi:hypothetical protein